jgi:hypothetical protein
VVCSAHVLIAATPTTPWLFLSPRDRSIYHLLSICWPHLLAVYLSNGWHLLMCALMIAIPPSMQVLGEGELSKPLTIKAAKFSSSASEKIAAAGATAEELPQRAKWTRRAHEKVRVYCFVLYCLLCSVLYCLLCPTVVPVLPAVQGCVGACCMSCAD